MKFTRSFGPLWLGFGSFAIIAWLFLVGWHLRSENQRLRRPALLVSDHGNPRATFSSSPAPVEEPPAAGLRLEDLRAETQREIAAREAAEAKIAILEKQLPLRDGEVVVSFGRIEQMGQRAGKAVLFCMRQAAAGKPGAKPLPDSAAEDQTTFGEFIGQLGELRAMEDESREIARFQAATLREVLGFDEVTAQRTRSFLETEFARLKAQQLTGNFRPKGESDEWDRRRDAAMLEIAARLCPLLPANHAQLPLVPGILSLGGGIRTKVIVRPDGHGSVNASLPLFPENPL